MAILNIKINWKLIFKAIMSAVVIGLLLATLVGMYLVGMVQGYKLGQSDTEGFYSIYINNFMLEELPLVATPVPTKTPQVTETQRASVNWGGPELWSAVNTRRTELGVNTLLQADDLCTIAAIRLNDLLELGKLDGHEGFSNFQERRPDLQDIFDKYGTIAEFLASGGESAQDTVSLWENTLGHKKLLTGGEFVWGCIYAQDSFAVAISAY